MKIIDFKLSRISAELKKPFVTNLRRVDAIEDVLLTLVTDEGVRGYGEAPPTVAITGEDIVTMERTIDEYIFPAIKNIDIADTETLFAAIRNSIPKNTSAKACVDIAVYDILSKTAGKPLCEYLGGKAKRIKTDLTISLNDIKTMTSDAVDAYNDGFEILKIKVGVDESDSIEVIKNIRNALPKAILRVDANQAWDEAKSLRIIDEIAKYDIELVEQPVKAHEFEAMKNITTCSSIPILADESVFSYEDAVRIVEERAAHYINIKLMKTGGINEALKIVNLAKAHGVKIMMGSMLESVVSISAGVHFAMIDDSVCFYDLDGVHLAKPSNVKNALRFEKDEIFLSPSTGLGIEF